MTFKEQIKKLANSKAYSRGLEIYNKGKILRFQAEENNREEMVLEALVKGSGAKNHGRHPSASEKKCRCQKSSTDPGRHLWKSTAGTALDCGKPKCCVAL